VAISSDDFAKACEIQKDLDELNADLEKSALDLKRNVNRRWESSDSDEEPEPEPEPDADIAGELREAAKNGLAWRVQALASEQCVNSVDDNGSTALHFAAGGDHVTTIDLLLARGAGIDVQNGFGWTPLMSAAALNCTGAIRRLLDEGANRQLKSKAGQKAAAIAQKYAKLDAYSLLCNYTL
jgi:ankyrin repeat protein